MKKIESLKKMSNKKKLILLGFVIVLLVSCAKDILVTPPDSLFGYYIGRYYVTVPYSSQLASTDYINVGWSFTTFGHICSTAVVETEELNLCSFAGEYTVADVISFTGTRKNGLEVCDDEFFPFGEFTVQWTQIDDGNDTLILQQHDIENDILYRVVMEKQPDIEE